MPHAAKNAAIVSPFNGFSLLLTKNHRYDAVQYHVFAPDGSTPAHCLSSYLPRVLIPSENP